MLIADATEAAKKILPGTLEPTDEQNITSPFSWRDVLPSHLPSQYSRCHVRAPRAGTVIAPLPSSRSNKICHVPYTLPDTPFAPIVSCPDLRERAASYQMVGNFLAACNEYEAAAKIVSAGLVKQPKPDLMVAMDTNHGVW